MRNNGIRIDFNQGPVEDDDIVIISRIGKVFNAKVEIIDVAIKDENGDITSIMEVKHKILGYL